MRRIHSQSRRLIDTLSRLWYNNKNIFLVSGMDEKNIVSMDFSRDISVVQANELVRSKQDDLSLLEAKLIRLAIGQVLKNDTDFRTYSCSITDLSRFLGIQPDNLYTEVQKLGISLMRKAIFVRDTERETRGKPNYKIFHWVDYVEYQSGTITIRLSESLRPYLTGLDKLFTMYGYSAILDLPTNYSIRLYELIASYHNMVFRPYLREEGTRVAKDSFRFTIEELRTYFSCEKKYPNTADFIKRVIDTATKAIQLNTDARISYSIERKGRKITHIIFKIHGYTDTDYNRAIELLRDKKNNN